jgi:hypothetical protein
VALQNCPPRRHITTGCEHAWGHGDFNRGLPPHDCRRITSNPSSELFGKGVDD